MGCASSKASTVLEVSPPKSPAPPVLDALKARTVRTGKWFVVHSETLFHIEVAETVDMYSEFWQYHPNGTEELREYYLVRLDDDMIVRQHALVQISSYRWLEVRGVGPKGEYATPGNFMWFLHLCRDHGYIGWMDFMANVVANVPTAETIAYSTESGDQTLNLGAHGPRSRSTLRSSTTVGLLYADQIVLPQGLYEPSTLGPAMGRGWVFQETAFGALNPKGVDKLMEHMSTLGERVRAGDAACLCDMLLPDAAALATLLERRGWDALLHERAAMLTMPEEYDATDVVGCNDEAFADVLVQRLDGSYSATPAPMTRAQLCEHNEYPRDWALYQRVLSAVKKANTTAGGTATQIVDYFTRPVLENAAAPIVREALTMRAPTLCATCWTPSWCASLWASATPTPHSP